MPDTRRCSLKRAQTSCINFKLSSACSAQTSEAAVTGTATRVGFAADSGSTRQNSTPIHRPSLFPSIGRKSSEQDVLPDHDTLRELVQEAVMAGFKQQKREIAHELGTELLPLLRPMIEGAVIRAMNDTSKPMPCKANQNVRRSAMEEEERRCSAVPQIDMNSVENSQFSLSFESVKEITDTVEEDEEMSTLQLPSAREKRMATASVPVQQAPPPLTPQKTAPRGALKRGKVVPIDTLDASVTPEVRKIRKQQDILLESFHTEVFGRDVNKAMDEDSSGLCRYAHAMPHYPVVTLLGCTV